VAGKATQAPDPGKTSIRFGEAFLRPTEEKDHYELMRPIVTVRNEGGRVVTEAHPQPIGPLAIYRRKRRGDDIPTLYDPLGPPPEMRTVDKAGQPIDLVLVWWPKMEKGEGAGE
jgi:hypothetical protein